MASHNVVVNMNVAPHGLHTGDPLPNGDTRFKPGSVALSFAPSADMAPEIGANMYAGVESLHSVRIPPNTSVKANAFRDCQNLKTVYVEDPDTTIISTAAFAGCPKVRMKSPRQTKISPPQPVIAAKTSPPPRQPRSVGGQALADAY